MLQKTLIAASASLIALAAASTAAQARDRITIVGSSTVFPFATAVAERFGKSSEFDTPVVESTGSGGGLKLFCAGTGENTPDITNASRRIKESEVKLCAENGIEEIVEVKIGYDGIVLANSRSADVMNVSLKELYMALAKDVPTEDGKTQPNPYTNWSEINPELPDVKIEVLGPPPTSGTRDAFVELAMEGGCDEFEMVEELEKDAYKALCHTIREDGAFVEAGENDNLIVQKLDANPDAFGIFGYSFLDQNSDKVQGSQVSGIEPTFENIADGAYPVSRSLYFYVKKPHIGVILGIEEYLAEFTSDNAAGPEGYLADKGLIPMSDAERKEWKDKVSNLENLSM